MGSRIINVIQNILFTNKKMVRQQLREDVKRVFTGTLGGGDWVESTLTSGNILKLLPTITGGKLPIFFVMIPQESGIGAGGLLREK